MKRFFLLVLSIATIIGVAACSNNAKIADQDIPIGTYIMEESEDFMKPIIKLEGNNKFTFNYSLLSSYFAFGSYVEDELGNLILKTDDGKFQYVFKIKDKTLIFNASESAEIQPYANVPDGAIFLQIENETENETENFIENILNRTKAEEYYFEPSISVIEGQLITRMYYGPPNYGENPDTDSKQYPFILELDKPINVIAEEDDEFNSDKLEVTEIQVVPMNKEQTQLLEQYINKRVIIQGTLFEAIFGGHHTEVLIQLEKVLY